MSEYGELGKKLKEKIFENQGKVSFAFGVAPILAEAKSDLRKTLATNQKVDVGIILMDWFEKWLGSD